MNSKIQTEPNRIYQEYKAGTDFKAGLGTLGIFEQTKRNERFYVGDQWYGAKTGNTRPLVRRNIIKRIGEYKMSVITSAPVCVNYSADGISNTADMQDKSRFIKSQLINGNILEGQAQPPEISAITSAMSEYFNITAERIKLDNKKEQVLKNAYISGTGILFTYWDSEIETGLFADEGRTQPIKGDICSEVLDIENVCFGDPNNDEVRNQPYIIISQRRNVDDVRRETNKNGLPYNDIVPDKDNITYLNSGDLGEEEPKDNQRVTVYTKLYKEWNKDGSGYKIMAVRVTEKAIVRKTWDLMLKNYPIAKFSWERRRSSIYGESEITHLIPNQIAINRALTSSVWGVMQSGTPIMLVNGDTVTQPITNDPGQIIKIYGTNEDVLGAIRYVQPPNATSQFQNTVNDLCASTLSDSGANDAALGNLRPDNAAAIIQMREAATAPMQLYMNRFYDFIEDIARIWADFWINMYSTRSLKIKDKLGTQYITFVAERYKSLLITAKVDVGAATMYSEAVVVSTLDNLLSDGLITFDQYLERLPAGIIPDVTGLREEIKNQLQTAIPGSDQDTANQSILESFAQQYPQEYQTFQDLPPEQQQSFLQQISGFEQSGVNGI